MKTLKILKVFLGLKWREFKEWFIDNDIMGNIICFMIMCFIIIIVFLGSKGYFWAKIIVYILIGLCAIMIVISSVCVIHDFFKWLINLCRDNWKKAKKIVEGE
jgi:hypothetical protein